MPEFYLASRFYHCGAYRVTNDRRSFLDLIVLTWYQLSEPIMSINVKLSEALVDSAKRYGAIEHRSVPKQIEYWSQIGKIAAENPDLPFSVIRDILIADQEEPVGEYQFDS